MRDHRDHKIYYYEVLFKLLRKSRTGKDSSCPIYVRILLNSKRVELSTGIRVLPDKWDEVHQVLLGEYDEVHSSNERLRKIKTILIDIYNRFVSSEKDFDVTDIKNEFLGKNDSKGILEVFDYYLKTIENNIGHAMPTVP